MLEALIAVLLALILGAVSWIILIGQQRIASAREQVARTQATVEAAQAQMQSLEDVNERLRDLIDDLRDSRRDDMDRAFDNAMHYEEIIGDLHDRIDELTRQNQNLAERVASLRQDGLSEGGEDFHVEDAEDDPWSPELQSFYDGLNEAGQAWAEHFIEVRRARGMPDEQILDELDAAGSIS